MADTATRHNVTFPPLDPTQKTALRTALGPMVALANPLDYHTFIWDDVAAMTATFSAILESDAALGCIIADFPREDRCSAAAWECILTAGAEASRASATPVAIVATLPEALSESVATRAIQAGLIPLLGLDDALSAISAAAMLGALPPGSAPLLSPGLPQSSRLIPEARAKQDLHEFGLSIPHAMRAKNAQAAADAAGSLSFPVVLKAEGLAHKTEAGGVALGLEDTDALMRATQSMPAQSFLIEEMVTGGVAELLIGVVRDPAHGFVLTLAAGGVLTELMADSVSLLLPVTPDEVDAALGTLRIAPLLDGYRGKPGADRAAIVNAVIAVQSYVTAFADRLDEVEINPLICTPAGAVAADALIRIGDPT